MTRSTVTPNWRNRILKYFPDFPKGRISRQLIQNQGFSSKKEFADFYKKLTKDYESIDKEIARKRTAALKKREQTKLRTYLKLGRELEKKRKIREEVIRRTTITIDDLIDIINDRPDGPFELILKSYVNSDMTIEKKFKCKLQAQRWAMLLKDAENDFIDSSNAGGDSIPVNSFARFTYEINPIVGGANESNIRAESKTINGTHYNITIEQRRVRYNNCGPDCIIELLGLTVSAKNIREAINKPAGELFTIDEVFNAYNKFNPSKKLEIHTIETDNIDSNNNNILWHKEHYSIISGFELKDKDKKTQRGIGFWDIETRATEDYCLVGDTKSYYLKATILQLYYKPIRATAYKSISFTTNDNKCAVTQFKEWMVIESRAGRNYNFYAHNGGNFDVYFLLTTFTPAEKGQYVPSLRGSTIIDLQFGGHSFKDTCCFMPTSLSKLSKSYQVKTPKLTSFIVDGRELSNEQMCFFEPKRTFKQFMALQTENPIFWKLYTDYCLVDCIALAEIWEKFSANCNRIVDILCEIAPYAVKSLRTKCNINQACTIGSLAMKIQDALNPNTSFAMKKMLAFIDNDQEKHDFIMQNFKIGGISHCHQKGLHMEAMKSVDECSMYPNSLINQRIPCGKSWWVTNYDESYHGFFKLKNLKFNNASSYKPICINNANGTRQWATSDFIPEVCCDTYMIKYLKYRFNLVSFDVERGLVSKSEMRGDELWGKYVNTFFMEKEAQDALKVSNDPMYNPSYRETIKLFLNAPTGKAVMDKSKYFSLKFTDEKQEGQSKTINGVSFMVEDAKSKQNKWITSGVMTYSHSKRHLFEYMFCLPDGPANVTHTETDSIYFADKYYNTFKQNVDNYKGEYNLAFGDKLGNIKIEMDTAEESYFLGKKTYYIQGKCVWKGIPSKTIQEDGTVINFLNKSHYEAVYNHIPGAAPIMARYSTLNKKLFGKTAISQHWQTRALNSTYDYKIFE